MPLLTWAALRDATTVSCLIKSLSFGTCPSPYCGQDSLKIKPLPSEEKRIFQWLSIAFGVKSSLVVRVAEARSVRRLRPGASTPGAAHRGFHTDPLSCRPVREPQPPPTASASRTSCK